MKLSLLLRLTGSFGLIMLGAAAALILSVRLITETSYARLVRDTDKAKAESLAPVFAQWYQQNGWNGVQRFVDSLSSRSGMMEADRNWSMMGWGMMDSGMMDWGMHDDRGMMGMWGGGLLMGSRLVLSNADGEVIADSNGELLNRSMPPRGRAQPGIAVVSGGQGVGQLFVGSMIGPSFTPADRQFLGSVNVAVLLTSAAAVLLSLVTGALLFRHIVSPLRRLTGASERIASGDLAVRVPQNSSDELGVLEGRFNAMASALQDSRRRQQQLIADAAHELRTPVSLIQGTLEMMVEGIYPADRARLEQLHEESRRLGGLVADMQDLSRADAGRMELSLGIVRIEEIMEEAITPFRATAQRNRIKLDVVGNTSGRKIKGDHDRLVRVLANLLANAMRHTSDGGQIKVSAGVSVSDDSSLQVCVQDNGPGIPASEAERVFDRFYRTDISRNRDSGGSGLGMAISREIINAHGGKIWVDKTYRHGARVCFRLPITSGG